MAKRRSRPATQLTEDEEILIEAKERFKRAKNWESQFHILFTTDVKFANGDSDNGWQWPDDLRKDRETNKRPALTINKTQRHVSLITNDARQNKPSITVRPTNDLASFKSAQVYEGLIRDIEYKSGAQDIYDEATDSQVEGGVAYWRIEQVYTETKSFNQELRIGIIKNPLNVYLDCDIKRKDGLDSNWGFIFSEIPREEFDRKNPDYEHIAGSTTALDDADSWLRDDYVREAEYYRILEIEDELYWLEKGDVTFLASEAPKNFRDELVEGEYRTRKVTKRKLEWYKIVGDKIIERDIDRKGEYVPVVRLVGIEKIIDGQLERKGFVRALKDAQRMYNYNSSAQVESAALATKTKWVGADVAFEGNEVAWNNANRSNAAYLTFKYLDSEGDPLPPQALPQHIDPAQSTPAYLDGMKIADMEMMAISGQEHAQLGMAGNERSGKAINERQRQSDIATYLWVNNLAIAIRATGVMIIDLVPHIYDTKRVLQILGKDGTESHVTLDPEAKQSYYETKEEDVVKVLFNPAVGKYEVRADPGPAYSTQRQEAWNAFVQIVTGAPALIDEIGDLMFRSADFPLADKIAERLRRKIEANSPFLLGDSPPPAMQQLTEALKASQSQVADLITKLAEKNLELKNKETEAETRRYEAESHRLTAETNAVVDLKKSQEHLEGLLETIAGTLAEMQKSGGGAVLPQVQQVAGANGQDIDEEPPVPGAVKHDDGNWYVEQGGQWHAVVPHG